MEVESLEYAGVDDITYFKYLYNKNIIIKNPNYIVKITSILSSNTYRYGTYMPPPEEKSEHMELIIKKYMRAAEEYASFEYNRKNFNVEIIENKYE